MKKILATMLAASMMLFGAQAFAQTAVNAGYLNSTFPSKDDYNHFKNRDDMNGFYAGASRNIPMVAGVGVEPGVNLEMLFGSKYNTTEAYLQVPVMFNYGIELMPDCRLFAFAGPTLSLGLISSVKSKNGTSQNIYKHDEAYSRFDVMLGGGIGFDINRIRIKVGYNAGILDRDLSRDITLRRSEITLGAAFLF